MLHWLHAPWGASTVHLAHPATGQHVHRASNSSSPFRQDFEAPPQQPTALHCTAHASSCQIPRSTPSRRQRKHRNRPEACVRPLIRSSPAFLVFWPPLPQRVWRSYIIFTGSSSPRATAQLLTALTPSKAATLFHFGPSLHYTSTMLFSIS